MPETVSNLENVLAEYAHPEVSFVDALNEVIPQLASRGIWKELTFERSVFVDKNDKFFTLPEDADSILFSMVNDRGAEVRPLWTAFVNAGNYGGRMGHAYGIEDAGMISTREVLPANKYYQLRVETLQEDVASGDDYEVTSVYSRPTFDGTEVITVDFTNWEGVRQVKTFTLVAGETTLNLPTLPVARVNSVTWTGVNPDKPLKIHTRTLWEDDGPQAGVFVGEYDNDGAGNFTLTPLVSAGSQFTVFPSAPTLLDGFNMYPCDDTNFVGDAAYDDDWTWLAADGGGSTTTSVTGTDALRTVVTNELLVGIHLTDYDFDTDTNPEYEVCRMYDSRGVARYHAFRVHAPGTTVHCLFRRKLPRLVTGDDLVYLDNISALKYALLANTAEFNNDLKQAREWWAEAERELNAELNKHLGAAQPQIRFDPSGGLGAVDNLV